MMPIEKLIPLSLPPGMYRNGTKYQAKGRYFDGNLVRWLEGTLRPMGGWEPIEWSASGVQVTDSQHFADTAEPVVLSDTFFDTASTELEDHTPVGSPNPFTWLADLGADTVSASLVIDFDTASSVILPRDLETGADWPPYNASFPMGGADYEAQVNALVKLSTFSTDFGGVGVRLTGGTQRGGYAFGVIMHPTTPEYALYVLDTDGSILRAVSEAVPTSDIDTVVTLKIRAFGSTITGLVNDVEQFQITDTTYTQQGEPGLVLGWAPFQTLLGGGAQFQWFKQQGFFNAVFEAGGTILSCEEGGHVATYTVGVPNGHIGDANPVLPTDYKVSVVVHTKTGSNSTLFGAPNFGAGVIARAPLSALFDDVDAYYFVYNGLEYKLCGATGSNNIHVTVPFFSVTASVPSLDQDADVTLELEVNGNVLTGTATGPSGTTTLTTTDSTFPTAGRAGLITPWVETNGVYLKGPWFTKDIPGTTVLLSDTLIDVDERAMEDHAWTPDTTSAGALVDDDLGFRQPFIAKRITSATPPDIIPSKIFSNICLAGLPRGSWAWKTNDGASWFAVGTTTDAYKMADGILTGLSPWAASTPGAHSWADTSFGLPRVDGVFSSGGYGRGPYGLGKYGIGTGALTIKGADTWSFDNFDQQLVGCFTHSEEIYRDVSGVFQVVPNAPSAKAIVVTPERFMFALAAGGDMRLVDWCDAGDLETWAPTATNQAGGFFLSTRGNLRCGLRTRHQTMLWTDADAWVATYVGGEFIYNFQQIGDHCGIISPHAACVVGDVAYWMSYGRFFVYDGATKPLSCDVQDYVFGDFQDLNREKVWAMSMTQFDEVWWFYPSKSQVGKECDRFVIYNYREGIWYFGTLDRGTGQDRDVFQYPLMVGNKPDPNDPNCIEIFEHEFGDKRDQIAFAETGPLELGGTAKQGPIADSYVGDIGGMLQRVQHIIPDERNQGDIRFYIYTTNYPSVPEHKHGPFSSLNPKSVRFTARQVRIRYEEDPGVPQESWRVGVPRLGVLPAGRR